MTNKQIDAIAYKIVLNLRKAQCLYLNVRRPGLKHGVCTHPLLGICIVIAPRK